MKERTQGKAKLHIARDMGKIDKAIRCMNRSGYDPSGEERKRRQHALDQWGNSPRPHDAPCACRFCYCWDMWQEIERTDRLAIGDTSGNVKPQPPQVYPKDQEPKPRV